ncbi:MAG: enoyl-CoA hydratase [Spirochaeta sp.]|nr:enoyl-CoA hydratase [Spirochaeta sp.]RPG04439.1 MAG: enoyl-CoA hydratase [Proteobacteria bacterium TMED72]
MVERKEIETGTEDLLAYIEDGVAVLTMNRPERRNALSAGMIQGLADALAVAETADDVGCVVLTGAGGAFCAGGDVKGMAESEGAPSGMTLDAAIHLQRLQQRATAGRIYEMPKPVIASLPGAAAGAGLGLALSCDIRLASEEAMITTAFAKVGFAGDWGGTFFMTQLIGPARTRELYYLSDRIEMQEAERLGLVNHVVPAEELESRTLEMARRIASGPRIAYRYMKENISRAVRGDVMDCMDLEVTHHVHTSLTRDHKEAVKAFVDKRTPTFEGR